MTEQLDLPEDVVDVPPARTLETARLLLRPFTTAELEAVADGRPVQHFAGGFPSAEDMDLAEESLEAGSHFFTESVYARLAIVEKASGQIVGTGGFVGPPIDDELEIVGSLTSDFQDRGYAQEGLAALVELAFTDPAVVAVRASVPEGNAPAAQVLLASGFVVRETPGPETDYVLPRPE